MFKHAECRCVCKTTPHIFSLVIQALNCFYCGYALHAHSHRLAIPVWGRVGIAPKLIWLKEFVCSSVVVDAYFYCVERIKVLNHVRFCALFSRIRNNAVLMHKLLWIPRDCAEVVNNQWQGTAVQRASYESLQSCCSVFHVFFLSSCLKDTDMGLHLLSLSNLYTARVYECYFTGIAVCVYSPSNLPLQHSIKINK